MPSESSPSSTSLTLIGRICQQPADQAAWTQFTKRYGRMIQNWCRRWGLGPHDAEDVSQKVLMQLSRQMANFEYDAQGSFRGWLKTIAYRAWCDYHSGLKRSERGSGDSAVMEMLNSTEAREHFLQQIEEEWNRELLMEAMRHVKTRVQPHTWEAFRLMSQEGMSGQEVAEKLNMKVGAVWVAKSKVQKHIADELRKLEELENTTFAAVPPAADAP